MIRRYIYPIAWALAIGLFVLIAIEVRTSDPGEEETPTTTVLTPQTAGPPVPTQVNG